MNEYRESAKELQIEKTNYQGVISDLKLELEREKEKVRDRERKLADKDEELSLQSAHNKKNVGKLESDLELMREESDALADSLRN